MWVGFGPIPCHCNKSLHFSTTPPNLRGRCFDATPEDGTNTVSVTFGDNLAVSEETVDSITLALSKDLSLIKTVVSRPVALIVTRPYWPPVDRSKAALDLEL
jgi:hypothetical protein